MLINKVFLIFTIVVSNLLILLIKAYQLIVSPLLPKSCRFYPTCSAYAIAAIKKHGCMKGMYLAMRRIVRCHPFHEGGYDPVPDKFPS